MAIPTKATVLRAFSDAGTGQRFAAGARVVAHRDTLANYEAAGLVKLDEAEASQPVKPKRTRRSRGRA